MMRFSKFAAFVIAGFLFSGLSGCYPMPRDGEYSLIPTTNNPDVVGCHGGSELLPGGGF
jgi:hypothetical protein